MKCNKYIDYIELGYLFSHLGRCCCNCINNFYDEFTDTGMLTYDTEVNLSLERLNDVANKFEYLNNDPIFGDESLLH